MNIVVLLNYISLILIVVSAFLAISLEDLLSAVVAYGVAGLLLSLQFYLLQAPDVAITEASIGAGLTIALFIFTLRKTQRWEK